MSKPSVGDLARIERDENRYPPKGSWPRFFGKTGTVIEVNADRNRPHLTEYGISFTKRPRTDAWFKLYELTVMCPRAAVRHAEHRESKARHDS